MKRKINITFEVSTEVEVDLPDGQEISTYVSNNYNEIVTKAKETIKTEGVDKYLTWDTCSWSDDDEVFDIDEFILRS